MAGSRSPHRIVLTGGHVYSGHSADATALVIVDGRIAWLGDDRTALSLAVSGDRHVDLQGALVCPGFVDAHVHVTSTGLVMTGLDLTGIRSRRSLIEAITAFASTCTDPVLLGHGWDDSTWPEDGLPTQADLDTACGGRPMYLSRIDVHSALVSTALLRQVPQAADLPGFGTAVSNEAHHLVRTRALDSIDAAQRRRAQVRVLEHASSRGIVALHENAGPTISSEEDLTDLLALARAFDGPRVIGYWAQLAQEGGIDRARSIGAHGVAGDLFVDGALGSRTACLCEPYRDAGSTSGTRYLQVSAIAGHIVEATRAGMQAGFHVIGDSACSAVIDGFLEAEKVVGEGPLRAGHHRLEHAEMLSDRDIAVMSRLGIIASMQPMFDALWGGVGGMYEQRLGFPRCLQMNRFADLNSAHVALAFSSDSPVTAMEPWLAVRAAVHHHTAEQSLSLADAFAAHTRGGWQAMGNDTTGVIEVGAPAHLALWNADGIDMHEGLPTEALDASRCLATFVDGMSTYSNEQLRLP